MNHLIFFAKKVGPWPISWKTNITVNTYNTSGTTLYLFSCFMVRLNTLDECSNFFHVIVAAILFDVANDRHMVFLLNLWTRSAVILAKPAVSVHHDSYHVLAILHQ